MITEEDFDLEHDKLVIDMHIANIEKETILSVMRYLKVLKRRLFI
jgi:hypothetical protein